jgi:hypothetical protein
MVAPAPHGLDLFKIAGRSISGWIHSLKTGRVSHIRQPFCSQLEERLLLWLEYHPQVKSYARGDICASLLLSVRCQHFVHLARLIWCIWQCVVHKHTSSKEDYL